MTLAKLQKSISSFRKNIHRTRAAMHVFKFDSLSEQERQLRMEIFRSLNQAEEKYKEFVAKKSAAAVWEGSRK